MTGHSFNKRNLSCTLYCLQVNAHLHISGKIADMDRQVGNRSVRLVEFAVGDSTAACKLSLWAQQIDLVEIGKCFEAGCLRINRFGGQISLSATKASVFVNVPSCEIEHKLFEAEAAQPVHLTTIAGEFSTVTVSCSTHCVCKAIIDRQKLYGTTYKCQSCQARTKVHKLKATWRANLVPEGHEGVVLFENVLQEFLQSVDKVDLFDVTKVDYLEEFFLENEFSIKITDQRVVKEIAMA